MKTCTKCKETKSITEFGKKARGRDGLRSQCKACVKIAGAEYRAANHEKIKASAADYYADNLHKIKASNTKRHAENPGKKKAHSAKYYAENTEAIKAASAKHDAANPGKKKARKAQWDADHPEACRIKQHNRRARKREVGGKLSKDLSAKLFKLQRGKCACCGKPLGTDYHLDHRMPLALGGANEDWNIQLLRATCNLQKSAKHPIDFMQSKGLLL